jgi:Protein of unknown function (DUF3352)
MRRLVGIVAVLLAVVAVAGCGSDKAGAPDQLVPASTLVYAQVTLEPKGGQKAGLDVLLSKFPGGSGQSVKDLVGRLIDSSDSKLSYARDVKPWLGDQAAVFAATPPRVQIEGTTGGPPDVSAVLVATTDEDKAMKAMLKTAKGRVVDRSYKGVDYKRDSEGAVATLGGYLVTGAEAGVRRAIAVSKGDVPKLSDSKRFKDALSDASDDRLGTFFVNTPRLLGRLRSTLGTTAAAPFERLLRDPTVATLTADARGADVDSTIPPQVASFFLPVLGKGSDLIQTLPGDSWAAGAQPEIGKTLDRYIDLLASSAGGRAAIDQQLRARAGIGLKGITGWMGDLAYFVRGDTAGTVNGALVIETTDPPASKRALLALRRPLASGNTSVGKLSAPGGGFGYTVRDPSAKQPIHVFQRGGRVVVAYGDDAATEAVKPSIALGNSAQFKDSASALGSDYAVSTLVLLKPIIHLVDDSSSASDADWQRAKPYLEKIESVVAGTREQDGKTRSRFHVLVP